MQFLLDFLRKEAPKSGGDIPAYYRRALLINEALLSVYFMINLFLCYWGTHQWQPLCGLMSVIAVASLMFIGQWPLRLSLGGYAAVTFVWCGWYVPTYGWNCGGQYFLIPLLILLFFNIYGFAWLKILYTLGCAGVWLLLFSYSLRHPSSVELGRGVNLAFQMLNSLVFFLTMANLCILFSSNLQETERRLRLQNEQLHKEADTDPLTQLPNRRAMLSDIDLFREKAPLETFSVAIADIDFFKQVNDTYGHNCGDYTLCSLAELFREKLAGKALVCRWGGEEFCFFLPEKNLDEAAGVMMDICNEVRRMDLSFEQYDFRITVTIGIEENDFMSPLEEIFEKADQKLYIGKNSGRDQVVI